MYNRRSAEGTRPPSTLEIKAKQRKISHFRSKMILCNRPAAMEERKTQNLTAKVTGRFGLLWCLREETGTTPGTPGRHSELVLHQGNPEWARFQSMRLKRRTQIT